MYRYVIEADGDNEALHRVALDAAVEAVKRVNCAPVPRSYIELVDRSEPRYAMPRWGPDSETRRRA